MKDEIEIIAQDTYVDKTAWGPGQWNDEPDKVHFVVKENGMDGLAVRGPHGGWCGYIAIEPGHPDHGKDYDSVGVEVHGGLTYGSLCQEDGKICHVPREGRPHDVFWLGFDCAHYGDISPAYDWQNRREIGGYGSYKSLPYVLNQCVELSRQLKERA